MTDHTHREIDPVTGTETTGHEWDGLRELNTPLPRWWLWIFYATIIWSVGYWILYPSWPLLTSYTRGLAGWSSREAIGHDLAALRAQRGAMMDRLAQAPLTEIATDPQLLDFSRALGRTAFADNCAPCHGAGGGGLRGYPNLNDDEWLWGGRLDDIAATIRYGVRSGHAQARIGSMPAFGRDKLLTRPEIEAVTELVLSMAGLPVAPGADLATGKRVYAATCATCHGDDGKGKRELGAPNLIDPIWLYGSDRSTIFDGLWNGRGSVMPAWADRLDDTTVKALTVFVHTLGGGEK